ncbi:MAG: DUF1330 domain-containing protein [Deltaproteobacteria bacterium]|nr:DUF1330 domain-containing protein [Deltaproteobacteria bacterium]MBI2539308.1 DUF1330 domain-containing protein [Deltaproteobacteria bacterium]
MAAYVITEIDVADPTGYEEYKKMGPPTVAAYGGKFIARGGRTEVLEGDWSPKRIVVLEFESLERAKEWWSSKEYGPAKQVRQKTAVTNMIVVEGA